MFFCHFYFSILNLITDLRQDTHFYDFIYLKDFLFGNLQWADVWPIIFFAGVWISSQWRAHGSDREPGWNLCQRSVLPSGPKWGRGTQPPVWGKIILVFKNFSKVTIFFYLFKLFFPLNIYVLTFSPIQLNYY